MRYILYFSLLLTGFFGTLHAQDTRATYDLNDYVLSAGEVDNYIATQSITLKPNTWIKSGSTFSAKIISDAYISPSLSSSENYIFTRSYQSSMTSASGIRENKDVIESVTYFDGLGRAKQQVGIKATPTKKDVITHIGYDAFGRQALEYLPYGSSQNRGQYNGSALSQTHSFYKAAYDNTPNPYSEKVFEASPLNRVLEIGAPGASWAANPSSDSDHTIKFDYTTNGSNEVRDYGVSLSSAYVPTLTNSPAYYGANQLYVTVTKDENWKPGDGNNHTTREYKDKQGRVVLKRTYGSSDMNMDGNIATNEQVVAHDTYYVYDDYGNLTYVLPPKVNTLDGVSATELKELCYQYRYDNRNRLVEKQLPGKGKEYIVYNKLDQPILTQDANQEAKKEWLFTKYDAFGRVVYTGKDLNNTSKREALQGAANSTAKQFERKTSSATSYVGTPVYYSKEAYPLSFDQVLTVNYYDNYIFDTDGLSVPTSVLGQAVDTRTQSLATGSKVRVLDTNHWITTIFGYDKKGRVIYTASKNSYLSTTTVVESKLDFAGKVLETKTTHTKGSNAAIVTLDRFEYDHMGRLTQQTQKIGSSKEELIAHNEYDALGQLIQKKVGNTQSKPLQTIDYSYNVRGWLTAINDADNLGSDLFGFELGYNTSRSGAEKLYNGNISETYWKTKSDNVLRRYAYSYDALNRITKGAFNGNGQTDRYTLGSISYDKNGNITNLVRNGHINGAATSFGTLSNPMDKLSYTYHAGGNFLVKVSDTGNKNYGFIDGSNTDNDYGRDVNGNLTRDKNKGITNIAYNHLNMPTEIKFNNSNTQKINYTYSADGIKIRKVVNDGGNVTTTDYAGAYQYVNTNLEFIRNFEDGYVYPKNGGGFDYVYYYTDQLDNIRLMYSDSDGNGTIDPSTEIMGESHFYPFGLQHKGYNSTVNPIGSSFHKYDYQNQERQDELGLNWLQFKYRMHDPAIGRFVSIDPLAEDYVHNSTYAFAENKVIKYNELEGLEITLNKFDRMSYENQAPGTNPAAVFAVNSLISVANGVIDIFNYAGDLDRADQSGEGSLNKLANDTGDTASAVVSYAENTTLSEFGDDVGAMLSNVETYENVAGSIVAAGAVSKVSKLGSISKTPKVSPNVQKALKTLDDIKAGGGKVKMNNLKSNQELNMTVSKGSDKLNVRVETHTVPKKYGGNGKTPQRHMNVETVPVKNNKLPNKGHKILEEQ